MQQGQTLVSLGTSTPLEVPLWLGLVAGAAWVGVGVAPNQGFLVLLPSRHRAFVQAFSSQREANRQGSANPGCSPSLWELLGEVM